MRCAQNALQLTPAETSQRPIQAIIYGQCFLCHLFLMRIFIDKFILVHDYKQLISVFFAEMCSMKTKPQRLFL